MEASSVTEPEMGEITMTDVAANDKAANAAKSDNQADVGMSDAANHMARFSPPIGAPLAPLLHTQSGAREPRRYANPRRQRPERETLNIETPTFNADGTPSIYPDHYDGPGHNRELESLMSDFGLERRERGGRERGGRDGGGDRRPYHNNNRKRGRDDDDDGGRRAPTRRRYEEPIASRLRRELIGIVENPARTIQDEVAGLGRDIANNFEDDQVKGPFLDTLVQLLAEQPLKIPFVAAVVLYANDLNPEAAKEIIARAGAGLRDSLELGKWRSFKLILRFFACLQGILEDDGVFQICNQLFDWVIDLQSASTEDALGLELTKIILLTVPYALASTAPDAREKLGDLLDKTEIVASEAANHPLSILVDPYPIDSRDKPYGYRSVTDLLQKQLRNEQNAGWPLKCLPRVYKPVDKAISVEGENGLKATTKHALPGLTVPVPVDLSKKPLFPETFFSVYGDQEIRITPELTHIASSLIRDTMVDTVNILEFNRHACAGFMIGMDYYWAPNTFASRGITIDQLKNYPAERSRWKPEDIMLDAVFSQIFILPTAEHKLIYYHSLITEICKLTPSHIAPTLGRAIRWLFEHIDVMDMELAYRFLDWFAHHLSNFEFRWKWIEWIEYLDMSNLTPKKAFIIAALDKEIRLSFAKRIRETLPKEYHRFITEGKFKDVPEYKYNSDDTPYAEEGREIYKLMKEKAPEAQIQPYIDAIHEKAANHGIADPLVPSTDAYTTAMCLIGSKSMSHLLSQIERCKERLQEAGERSAGARRQIVRSVVNYWKDQPGIAVNIVDKLLNYTIVTPESVILWALGPEDLGNGSVLAEGWRYEMVAVTVGKVTNRVRQIVAAKVAARGANLPAEQLQQLEDTLTQERTDMRQLFATIEDSVTSVAAGAADGMLEADMTEEDAKLVKDWGGRWARVFRRKLAVEEAAVGELAVEAQLISAAEQATLSAERQAREEAVEAEKRRKWDEEREKRIKEEEREREEKEALEAKLNGEKNGIEGLLEGNGEDADAGMDMDVIE